MPTDNSTGKPGPQGWWFDEHESVYQTIYRERLHWQQLEDKAPARCTRRPAKAANTELLQTVIEKQKERSIDAGIDLTVLLDILFGRDVLWRRQLIGSCVASGGMRACTHRSCWEVVILGEPEETLGPRFSGAENISHFAPYSYRAGRRIGGLNGGDGSFCGAHIEGLMQYGYLACDADGLESDAYPEPQSMSTYRRWGNSDQLLERFAPQGKRFDLLESERVTSADQFKSAVCEHFKPAMVCSNWAFRPRQQHSQWKINGEPVWIYDRDRGNSWAHNMTLIACVQAYDEWWVKVMNSWGSNAHKNGDSFWIPLELVDTWLRSAEVRTIGDLAQRDVEAPIAW